MNSWTKIYRHETCDYFRQTTSLGLRNTPVVLYLTESYPTEHLLTPTTTSKTPISHLNLTGVEAPWVLHV